MFDFFCHFHLSRTKDKRPSSNAANKQLVCLNIGHTAPYDSAGRPLLRNVGEQGWRSHLPAFVAAGHFTDGHAKAKIAETGIRSRSKILTKGCNFFRDPLHCNKNVKIVKSVPFLGHVPNLGNWVTCGRGITFGFVVYCIFVQQVRPRVP